MEYKIPSYLISDLEIRLILVPMYGVPEVISSYQKYNRKFTRMAQDGQDNSTYLRLSEKQRWPSGEQVFFSQRSVGRVTSWQLSIIIDDGWYEEIPVC